MCRNEPRLRIGARRAAGIGDAIANGEIGDAGPDRQGLRTDTIMLFSLHTPSGRAALISIPRDMLGLLFPPGSALEARYPYGFERKANSVYPTVSSSSSLRRFS